jgi:hypothetical protein
MGAVFMTRLVGTRHGRGQEKRKRVKSYWLEVIGRGTSNIEHPTLNIQH